jgi:hypothetical protein
MTADLEALTDDGGWSRYEIINRELFVTRAPYIRHQNTAGNIQSSPLLLEFMMVFLGDRSN